MGILSKIFGGSPVAGTHPDSAIRTSERGEERKYIAEQFACPSCRKRGNKEIRGHSLVVRRLSDGRGRLYKVHNVLCGCGKFATFWSDASAWGGDELVRFAEEKCQANGKCVPLSGSGQMPYIDPSLVDLTFGR